MRSDHSLLRAWHHGDNEAGDTLVQRHFDRVYRFFSSKLDDGIEDLVQRVFLLALERVETLREDVNFGAYLLGVARNVLLQNYRTLGKANQMRELHSRSAVDLGASPSRVVAVREEEQVLLRALRRIPLELQMALELFYWEDLPIAEIAKILEIPEGTVKSRLHRAKGLLRAEIEAFEIDATIKHSTLEHLESRARSNGRRDVDGDAED